LPFFFLSFFLFCLKRERGFVLRETCPQPALASVEFPDELYGKRFDLTGSKDSVLPQIAFCTF